MFLRVKRICNRLATISLRLRTQGSQNANQRSENGRPIVHVDQGRTTSANIDMIGRPGQIEVLLVPLTRSLMIILHLRLIASTLQVATPRGPGGLGCCRPCEAAEARPALFDGRSFSWITTHMPCLVCDSLVYCPYILDWQCSRTLSVC